MAPHQIEPDVVVPIFSKHTQQTDLPHLTNPKVQTETNGHFDHVKPFELEDHPIDETISLRVAVIGAGLSGINAGIIIPIKVPGVDLIVFDKNADVGGTWFENVYPGVRCDIPAHVYQSTFSPNTRWTEEYAQGHEIREYWQSVARKYNLYDRFQGNTKVIGAEWNGSDAKWTLQLKDLKSNTERKEYFDVVITAIGRFNAWKLPDIPGIQDYEGHLRHASNWDKSFEPTGKNVAVIGNGASGIQVVPNIQKIVKRLDHYARSPTWLAKSFAAEGQGRNLEPNYYPKETIDSFDDPANYLKFRKELEGKFFDRFGSVFKNSEKNIAAREDFTKLMAERLQKKPEILDAILPDFSPNCRRLTPGPGYLEALTEDNVNFIRTPIARFTKTGIITADGIERNVDAIICCTGANRDMHPPFSITVPKVGTLAQAWTPDTYTYLGTATPSFPNLLFIQGPNGTGNSGTVPNQVETQVTYISQLLRKVTQQRIRTFSPSKAATDDFVAYSDAFFAKTVWTENCSSWANGGRPGGRIHGHWPGSASHVNHVRKNPRWEDWEWTYRTETGNRFAYFGNGWSAKELVDGSDRTLYLRKPEEVDLRSYHEEWWNL